MQKVAIIALLFAALLCTIACAKVTLKFEQPNFVEGIPIQLRITTTKDENLNGLKITSKLTEDEAKQATQPQVLQFTSNTANTQSLMYGASTTNAYDQAPCINAKTGQLIGSLSGAAFGNSLTFNGIGSSTWSDVHDKAGEYGAWDVLCAVVVVKQDGTVSKNFELTYVKSPSDTETVQFALETMPSWTLPKIEVNDFTVKVEGKKEKTRYVATLAVTVDRIGAYQVNFVNGVAYAAEEYEQSLWCTVGGESKAAQFRVNSMDLTIYAPKAGKIECTIKYTTLYKIDTKKDIEVSIDLTSTISGTKKFTVDEAVTEITAFSGSLRRPGKKEVEVEVEVYFPEAKALKKGAVIQMTFSSNVPVDKFKKESSMCQGADEFTVNGSVISVKVEDDDTQSVECYITFDKQYDYDAWKGATVAVTVSDVELQTLLGKNTSPLVAGPRPTVTSKDTKTTDGTEITVVDDFELENSEFYYIPVNNAVLVFALSSSSVSVSQDDMKSHLTCTLAGTELKLDYDDATMTWSSKLATIADGKPEFKQIIKCTRKYTKQTKFGYNITQMSSLQAAIVVLEKGNKYSYATLDSGSRPSIDQPKTRPSGEAVPTATVFGVFQSRYTIPTNNKITLDVMNTMSTNFQSRVVSLIGESKSKDDYTVGDAKATTYSTSTASNYLDLNNNERWSSFVQDELKPKGAWGLDLGNVWSTSSPYVSASISPQSFNAVSVIAVTPKKDKATPSFEIAKDAFKQDIKVEYNSNANSVTSSFSTSGEYNAISSSVIFATSLDGCGNVKGTQLVGYTLEDTFKDWDTSPTMRTNSCNLGDACEVNADCFAPVGWGRAVCTGKKCTFKALVAPKYIDIASNSVIASFAFVMVFAIIAILF